MEITEAHIDADRMICGDCGEIVADPDESICEWCAEKIREKEGGREIRRVFKQEKNNFSYYRA